MAAITSGVTTGSRHVRGDLVTRYFTGVAGSSGDTLTVPMSGVLFVDAQLGSTLTAISFANGVSNCVITFTSSAPFTGVILEVTGRLG